MSVLSDRRRVSKQERKSRTVHVRTSVWDEIEVLIEDGTYGSLSHAAEEALKLLVEKHHKNGQTDHA